MRFTILGGKLHPKNPPIIGPQTIADQDEIARAIYEKFDSLVPLLLKSDVCIKLTHPCLDNFDYQFSYNKFHHVIRWDNRYIHRFMLRVPEEQN